MIDNHIRYRRIGVLMWIAFGLSLTCGGCWFSSESEVVVYSALDREFSEPIFDDFTRQTGIKVQPVYDAESSKSVGLTQRIMREKSRPRCDVFWNNEILNTLRLENDGLLERYASPAAKSYPQRFRSSRDYWHGFAARARVLIVNTNRLPDETSWPTSILDLTEPKWNGEVGLAKPLFGTTVSHAACLFTAWGDEPAREFFLALKQNALVLSGNKQVAQAVGSGQLLCGFTDTDDAIIERERGMPVAIVYLDQNEGGMGTLFIPNTVSIINGAKNSANARRLIDYLLSPEVETKLAKGPSAQIPLNSDVSIEPRVPSHRTTRAMEIDFAAAASRWNEVTEFLRDTFATAD